MHNLKQNKNIHEPKPHQLTAKERWRLHSHDTALSFEERRLKLARITKLASNLTMNILRQNLIQNSPSGAHVTPAKQELFFGLHIRERVCRRKLQLL